MPIGTTAALLIGSGIAAGTQVAGATIASKGAKSAAKTQAEAATQAANTQAQYGREAQSRLDTVMAPYVNTGAQAMTTLGGLMGLGGGGPLQPQSTLGGLAPPSAPETGNPYANRGLVAPQAGTMGAAPPGYVGDYRSQYGPREDVAQKGMQQSQSSYSGQNGAPQLVRVQAPTGEVRLVPQQQAEFFKSQGATILG